MSEETDKLNVFRQVASLLNQDIFDPEGSGYDYASMITAGGYPQTMGPLAGHWGSVVPASEMDKVILGLPNESYLLVKGRNHPTWNLAEQ